MFRGKRRTCGSAEKIKMGLKCVYCEKEAEFVGVVSVCKEHLKYTENDIPYPSEYKKYWENKKR